MFMCVTSLPYIEVAIMVREQIEKFYIKCEAVNDGTLHNYVFLTTEEMTHGNDIGASQHTS